MAVPGEKSFCVLEYHTSESVVTVQREFRAKYAKDTPTDKTICAWYKQLQQWRISMHPCWRVCGKNLNIVWMCAVSPVVHTSNISSCQKKLFQFSCGCEQIHWGRSFGFRVTNVCNDGQHYEKLCILSQKLKASLNQAAPYLLAVWVLADMWRFLCSK
jgi:hypothetical protein